MRLRPDPDSPTRRAALGKIFCGGAALAAWPAGATATEAVVVQRRTLSTALDSPWGMAFLPDGRLLVTQKPGSMVVLRPSGNSAWMPYLQLPGVPAVYYAGQGGLLDVAIDPDFRDNRWVYFSYAEPGPNNTSGTAVARGRLNQNELQQVQVIFRQTPKTQGAGHYGSRLAFRNDGTLFVTLGERQKETPAQDVTNTLGKVVRINPDGSVPSGNPDFGPGSIPKLWSIGHRNPQGAAIHPQTGTLWVTEHGPQGGDELNVALPGNNYGWPVKSYGCEYGSPIGKDCRIGGGKHAPNYVEPVSYWVPTSIAPAGLMFYTGSVFPEWKHQAFLGALAGTALWRVELDGRSVVARKEMLADLGERIRCVKQGPDGCIYLLSDGGKLIRLER
jgi:glucose/arabinose dehydrogenase